MYILLLMLLLWLPFFTTINGYTEWKEYNKSWLTLNQSMIVIGKTGNAYHLKGYPTTSYYSTPTVVLETTDVSFLKVAENFHDLNSVYILVKQTNTSTVWPGCHTLGRPTTTHFLYQINLQSMEDQFQCVYPIPEYYDEFMAVSSHGPSSESPSVNFLLFYTANNVSRQLFKVINGYHEVIPFSLGDPNEIIVAIDTDRVVDGYTENFYFLTKQNVYVADINDLLLENSKATKAIPLFYEPIQTYNLAFNVFSNEGQVLTILNSDNQLNFYFLDKPSVTHQLGQMRLINTLNKRVEFYFEVPTQSGHNYTLYLTNGPDLFQYSTVTNPYELTNDIRAHLLEDNVLDTAGIRRCTQQCMDNKACVIRALGDYCYEEFNYIPYLIAGICIAVVLVIFTAPFLICFSYALNKRVYEGPRKSKNSLKSPGSSQKKLYHDLHHPRNRLFDSDDDDDEKLYLTKSDSEDQDDEEDEGNTAPEFSLSLISNFEGSSVPNQLPSSSLTVNQNNNYGTLP